MFPHFLVWQMGKGLTLFPYFCFNGVRFQNTEFALLALLCLFKNKR
jgi:hypothetical protein